MDFIHLHIISGFADSQPDISEGDSNAAKAVDIYGVSLKIVAFHCTEQGKHIIHSGLILCLNLRICLRIHQFDTVDHRYIFVSPAGNSLPDTGRSCR